MKKRSAISVVIGVAVLASTGCGLIKSTTGLIVNEPDNYLIAEDVPPLEVPRGLDAAVISNEWVIPDIPDLPTARVYPDRAPKPRSIVGKSDTNVIRIQKLGERRWMVVQRKPASIWPMVAQCLAHYSVAIERENPEAGLIVTGPLRTSVRTQEDEVAAIIRAEVAEAKDDDFLVLRVEQGIRHGTSEIHVRYLKAGSSTDELNWFVDSGLGQLEAKLLTQMAEFDASGLAQEAVSAVGSTVAIQPKAAIVRDSEGYPILQLNVDFERAWATVAQALTKAEIDDPIVRSDSKEFEIDVTDKRGAGGIFQRIWYGAPRANRVVLRVEESENRQIVEVLGSDGERLTVEAAEEVLALLRQFAA